MGNPERITCPLPMPSIGGYMKRGVIRTWQIDAICQCVDSGISGALESVNFPHPVPKYVRGDMHQGRHISSRHVTVCLRIVVYTSHNCSRKVGFLVYEAQLYSSENEINIVLSSDVDRLFWGVSCCTFRQMTQVRKNLNASPSRVLWQLVCASDDVVYTAVSLIQNLILKFR